MLHEHADFHLIFNYMVNISLHKVQAESLDKTLELELFQRKTYLTSIFKENDSIFPLYTFFLEALNFTLQEFQVRTVTVLVAVVCHLANILTFSISFTVCGTISY